MAHFGPNFSFRISCVICAQIMCEVRDHCFSTEKELQRKKEGKQFIRTLRDQNNIDTNGDTNESAKIPRNRILRMKNANSRETKHGFTEP